MKLFEKSDVFRILTEVISEGILIVDDQQHIVASNAVANRMFGYPEGELSGKPLEILIPKKIKSQHKGDADGFIQKGRRRKMGQGLDLVGLQKDGGEFPLEISLNPFRLLQRRYIMAIIVDISERKKSEQTIDHWFQVFNESLNEIYIFDAESLVFINVNRGAQLNLGYSMAELKQVSVLDIKTDLSEKNFKKLIAPLANKTREKVDFETIHRRKDGSTYPVEVHLQLSSIGKKQVFLAIVLDITERKNYTQHLENKVEERTEQLREALKAEKQLNELKTKFLSLVSHEFKTPLTSILTSTSLLSKYTETEEQQKRDKHINTIKEKVKYLDSILTDFLSIERLDTGKVKYNITSFPLSKLINEVVYNSNTLLKEGQRIQYPKDIDGITVSFDEKIMALALSNLLHNAIKYSLEDTSIKIQVAENDKNLQIAIVDQGLGIPEEDQPFIFERYFRASNVLTNQGTGIGLNIVKQHMSNLGADINFRSKLGEGSTFTVTIPIKNSDDEKNPTG
ncbi:PAS domain-containing sensor histidine kinase [Muricauda sp. CAU 1633]|uniref:sensor histidine kinase n=1 Tax=Allomuricauda sp. CAU 1633 TaxID=2816036 RepID=UPI001A8E36AD|nr:PAS domain-containing sensor histidine kinase [Muricauda sp. CAU 1633]MBO0323700.1 PAS domain-containing sensor histidine kinase [Muricauda sp. CAU 1633]